VNAGDGFESLGEGGEFEVRNGVAQGGFGDALREGAGFVATAGISDVAIKNVGVNGEFRRLGGRNVAGAVSAGEVCVIDNEWSLGCEAGVEEQFLAAASFEHVEVQSQMRVRETLLPERRFSGGWNSDEDEGMHSGCLDGA